MDAENELRLAGYRSQIAEIDEQIRALVERRLEVAGAVGALKRQAALPMRFEGVEARILERARVWGEAAGIAPDTAEALFEQLIRASVQRQYEGGGQGAETVPARPGAVHVVGEQGGMGGWFRRFFEAQGYRVSGEDLQPSRPDGVEAGLAQAGLVLVCTPLRTMPEVLAQTLSRRPPGLVAEIASVKSPLEACHARARGEGLRLVSLHPMFGPAQPLYAPKQFLVLRRPAGQADEEALAQWLSHPYSDVRFVPWPVHDRAMSAVLGMSHLLNVLFGMLLQASRELLETGITSTTFERMLRSARSVFFDNHALYYDIQTLNPHTAGALGELSDCLQRLGGILEARDEEGFVRLLREGRELLSQPPFDRLGPDAGPRRQPARDPEQEHGRTAADGPSRARASRQT
jgi:chorismate mutase / prephenate dehydrogenase